MSILAALPFVGDVLDKIFPDADKRAEAKLKLLELQQSGELNALASRAGIVTAEIQGESWLQRNWRPITMIWFGVLVGLHWFGLTPENLTKEEVGWLFDLVQVGLGGYVIGRSAEKIVREYKRGDSAN